MIFLGLRLAKMFQTALIVENRERFIQRVKDSDMYKLNVSIRSKQLEC